MDEELDIAAMLEASIRFKIYEARAASGMSREQLAKVCGWELIKIEEIEKGNRVATPRDLAIVLDACRYFVQEEWECLKNFGAD